MAVRVPDEPTPGALLDLQHVEGEEALPHRDVAICTTEAEARRKISTLRCSSAVRSPATSGAAGTMSSVRFTLLLTVILMIRVIMTFSTASGLSKELEGMPKPSLVFLMLFTSTGALFSFAQFVAFFGPLIGLVLGFDAINRERARRARFRSCSRSRSTATRSSTEIPRRQPAGPDRRARSVGPWRGAGGGGGRPARCRSRRQPLLHRFLARCGRPRLRALPQHGDLGVGRARALDLPRVLRPARGEGDGRCTRAGAVGCRQRR